MNQEVKSAILSSPVFSGVDDTSLENILDAAGCIPQNFTKSTLIVAPEKKNHGIGIIISGCAAVYSNDTGRRVLLRQLSVGGLFGVANVFSETERSVSTIIAKTACKVLFIPPHVMLDILGNDRNVLRNYIEFLSGRIRYLNRRILCFTAGSAERRLALYLTSFDSDSVTLEVPMNGLADMLDIGRASLYRAVDRLTEDGFIERDGNVILLKDIDNMLNAYK